MSEKRIYVNGRIGDRQYVGHMTSREAHWTFNSFEEISKAEYRSARSEGIQSWGEYATHCKREGREPQKRTGWVW